MKPQKDSKCGVCATDQYERNNYYYGKQFTVRDLLQEQSYFNDKRQLVNRMVLGWGVVCGLGVYWNEDKKKLVVEPGMALDCCGHEIVVCEDQYLSIDENDDDCCFEDKSKREGKFVLCLEYHECLSEPVDFPAAGCDEKGKTEHNRIRDAFKLRLKSWDDACPKEPRKHLGCLNRYKHDATDTNYDSPACDTEEIHPYLCHKLKQGCPDCEACDCVIIATIEIEATPTSKDEKQYPDAKQQSYEQEYKERKPPHVDPCTNRKLVYNNSLLYDLIYCYHGDLPHIVDFSWRHYTYPSREISIETFLQMMKEGLTVYFDQTMHPDSLNRHTFIVSYLLRDTGTGAFVENRVPLHEIKKEQRGDCYTATFVATERWINKELDADDSELIAGLPSVDAGVDIEITLRGSRIWSDRGKGLDGDYLADKLPTGNGTQGGDFVDWFRVTPVEAKQPKAKSYKTEF